MAFLPPLVAPSLAARDEILLENQPLNYAVQIIKLLQSMWPNEIPPPSLGSLSLAAGGKNFWNKPSNFAVYIMEI